MYREYGQSIVVQVQPLIVGEHNFVGLEWLRIGNQSILDINHVQCVVF
jgi:hypothetical protein